MLTQDQVIRIPISVSEMAFLRKLAANAEIGGQSQIRNGDTRQANLAQDQIVGQVGNYAGHKLLFGDVVRFRLSRYFADIYPTQGDGGSDVPGANIDFKASRLKPGRSPIEYNLLVRPHERHTGTVYIQIVVDLDAEPVTAHICGWLAEHELPDEPLKSGVLAGAYAVPVVNLHPLPPLRWYSAA